VARDLPWWLASWDVRADASQLGEGRGFRQTQRRRGETGHAKANGAFAFASGNKRLQMQLEIAKKAAAYFAKDLL